MVLERFSELTEGFTTPYARRKVLAGIVMTRSLKIEPTVKNGDISTEMAQDSAEVICVTTGTKCINGEYLSDRGLTLKDCHAEILSRRCLRRFFYRHLAMHQDEATAGDSIFVKDLSTHPNGTVVENGFILKEGIKFHLYISTSPCGDARIFSPHEASDVDEAGSDKHPNRRARGQLRSKIESGEGTIPVQNSAGLQTWDGIMTGERLLTMSCSDKVARWNVLGLQGEILTETVTTSTSSALDLFI